MTAYDVVRDFIRKSGPQTLASIADVLTEKFGRDPDDARAEVIAMRDERKIIRTEASGETPTYCLPPTFTKTEVEIIQHRLDVPDALTEYLMDQGDEPEWTEEEIGDAIDSVEQRLKADRWADMSRLEILVLVDCVQGSTWCACNESEQVGKFHNASPAGLLELSRSETDDALRDPSVKRKIRRVQDIVCRLAEKVENLTGCPASPALG